MLMLRPMCRSESERSGMSSGSASETDDVVIWAVEWFCVFLHQLRNNNNGVEVLSVSLGLSIYNSNRRLLASALPPPMEIEIPDDLTFCCCFFSSLFCSCAWAVLWLCCLCWVVAFYPWSGDFLFVRKKYICEAKDNLAGWIGLRLCVPENFRLFFRFFFFFAFPHRLPVRCFYSSMMMMK